MRIAPEAGSIEVGHICWSKALQGTRAASEAIYLFADWVFREGYRRFEWKCDALNRPSRRAAERMGFSFEGVFRQAAVVKGRNRDTAWFAMTDGDWRCLKRRLGGLARAGELRRRGAAAARAARADRAVPGGVGSRLVTARRGAAEALAAALEGRLGRRSRGAGRAAERGDRHAGLRPRPGAQGLSQRARGGRAGSGGRASRIRARSGGWRGRGSRRS